MWKTQADSYPSCSPSQVSAIFVHLRTPCTECIIKHDNNSSRILQTLRSDRSWRGDKSELIPMMLASLERSYSRHARIQQFTFLLICSGETRSLYSGRFYCCGTVLLNYAAILWRPCRELHGIILDIGPNSAFPALKKYLKSLFLRIQQF